MILFSFKLHCSKLIDKHKQNKTAKVHSIFGSNVLPMRFVFVQKTREESNRPEIKSNSENCNECQGYVVSPIEKVIEFHRMSKVMIVHFRSVVNTLLPTISSIVVNDLRILITS